MDTDRERRELMQQIQKIIQDKAASKDDPWVLETPDNGITVTKRRFSEQEKFYLENVNGKWYNYKDALAAVRQQDHEEELRKANPTLADAYQIYQGILAMVDPGSADHDNN